MGQPPNATASRRAAGFSLVLLLLAAPTARPAEPTVSFPHFRVQEIEHGTISARHVEEEVQGFLDHRLAEVVGEVREAGAIDGVRLLEATKLQPVAGELLGQAADARVAEHAPRLGGQHFGLVQVARDAMQKRFAVHDKSGEVHFNMLSAFHKSLRGSDPQGALYWMARMIEGGEDPMIIFRRSIAMAAEDIGLADPQALQLAVAARDAFHHLGPPEGYLPLAQMVIYLATAPKSNASMRARMCTP